MRTGATIPSYLLAEQVFSCVADDRIVFLDLRRNKYLCLSQHNTQAALRALSDIIEPEQNPGLNAQTSDDEKADQVLRSLIDGGLLSQTDIKPKNGDSSSIRLPETVLRPKTKSTTTTLRPLHWTRFLRASFTASWKLRRYSMQRTVNSVEQRKARRYSSRHRDRYTLRDLVSIFDGLRPYYVRKYLCLFDSLALVEFLALYRFYPTWVFGVRTEPFNAHCWVQDESYVLNDSLETVRTYTPIMAV